MTFNINEFRSVIDSFNGFQKLNKYRVRLPIPRILTKQTAITADYPSNNTGRYLEYFVNTADLPGVALLTRQISRYGYGPVEKKPFAPLFNEIMLTFYNDSGNVNLNFFHDWLSSITSFDFRQGIGTTQNLTGASVYEIAYKEDYVIDAEITLFDVAGNPIYTMVLRDFYPLMIPETKMSMEPQPTVMQIVVNFTFFDWYVRPPENPNPNPNPNVVTLPTPIPQQ